MCERFWMLLIWFDDLLISYWSMIQLNLSLQMLRVMMWCEVILAIKMESNCFSYTTWMFIFGSISMVWWVVCFVSCRLFSVKSLVNPLLLIFLFPAANTKYQVRQVYSVVALSALLRGSAQHLIRHCLMHGCFIYSHLISDIIEKVFWYRDGKIKLSNEVHTDCLVQWHVLTGQIYAKAFD